MHPQRADAYAGRALAYTALGKNLEAAEDVKRAEELGVDSASLEAAIQQVREGAKETP